MSHDTLSYVVRHGNMKFSHSLTEPEQSMLSHSERKARLPHGAIVTVACRTDRGVSTVSHVLRGVHRNRQIEKALAALMRPRTTVTEAFGPPGPEPLRRRVSKTHEARQGLDP